MADTRTPDNAYERFEGPALNIAGGTSDIEAYSPVRPNSSGVLTTSTTQGAVMSGITTRKWDASDSNQTTIPVAISGARVRLKVKTAVRKGDKLTQSDTAGEAETSTTASDYFIAIAEDDIAAKKSGWVRVL